VKPGSLFHEEQLFRQARVRLMLAVPPAILTLLSIWQIGVGHTWGKHPMSNTSLIAWTIFLWLVYLRLVTVRLVTEVRRGEVSIAMRGLWRSRVIPCARIKSVERTSFDPAHDFGGYGIRSTRSGIAYLAGGGEGVRLEIASGPPVIIGSKRPGELAEAIQKTCGIPSTR